MRLIFCLIHQPKLSVPRYATCISLLISPYSSRGYSAGFSSLLLSTGSGLLDRLRVTGTTLVAWRA